MFRFRLLPSKRPHFFLHSTYSPLSLPPVANFSSDQIVEKACVTEKIVEVEVIIEKPVERVGAGGF